MDKKYRKFIPIIPLILLIAGGIYVWQTRHGDEGNRVLRLQGNVDIRQVELAFNASGRIASLNVREGEKVEAGQLLGQLDGERLKLALAQAEAQVAAQQQTLARYQSGSRPEEIRQARAQRDAAQAAMADAEHVLQRQESLVEKQFLSRQQLDTSRFSLDKARAQLQASEETLHLAQLGPRKEDTGTVRANLAALEAAAATIRRDLAETELHAPSAGIVQNRILEVGDMANPAKPVLTLALTEPIWVRTWLAEKELDRVPVGAQATIVTDGQPERVWRGWVGYVSPTAEFTPKTVETTEIRSSLVYQARVFLCPGHQGLRLGMPATVRIALDQPAAAATGGQLCKGAP